MGSWGTAPKMVARSLPLCRAATDLPESRPAARTLAACALMAPRCVGVGEAVAKVLQSASWPTAWHTASLCCLVCAHCCIICLSWLAAHPLGPSPAIGQLAHCCTDWRRGPAWPSLGGCAGSNFSGQLGDGTKTDRTVPTAVSGNHSFAQISAGGHYTCGVRTDGTGLCWGK